MGSQQAGERSAVLLSLIESAKLNGHDPWAYLKDVFDRLPALKQRDLAQLLPHLWHAPTPPAAAPIVKLMVAQITPSPRLHRRCKDVVCRTDTEQAVDAFNAGQAHGFERGGAQEDRNGFARDVERV